MSVDTKPGVSRPLANFHPNHWHEHVNNLPPHDETIHSKKQKEVDEVKAEVKRELLANKDKPEELKFIDVLERLGVAYHFENEIEQILQKTYEAYNHQHYDLNHTSLLFRILRQHGYPVPGDIFSKFKDDNGVFKESLKNDVEGMLSLYEACHVRVHGDDILDKALPFTTSFLGSIVNNLGSPLKEKVTIALRQPVHRGMPRLETRHYITVYEKDPSHNPTLLRFAKLDFNLVQALHLKELKDFAMWWKSHHVKAPFSRDRFAEAFFCVVGVYFEPKYILARNAFKKFFKVASLLDDTCDAYATFEEIKLLTEAIQRWDKACIDQLPDHIKWTYKAILEAFDDVERELTSQGRPIHINYVIEQMKLLGQGNKQEAAWCHQDYVPTYDEYIKNGVTTSPYPYGIVASFLGMEEATTKEAFEWATQNPFPKAVTAASIIMRLLNDIYSHKFEQNRKHVASAVECYVKHQGFSKDEDVYKELLKCVEDAWKDINEAMLQPYAIPKPLMTRVLNLARASNEIYKGEDGYTIVSPNMKDKVAAVLFNPIPL